MIWTGLPPAITTSRSAVASPAFTSPISIRLAEAMAAHEHSSFTPCRLLASSSSEQNDCRVPSADRIRSGSLPEAASPLHLHDAAQYAPIIVSFGPGRLVGKCGSIFAHCSRFHEGKTRQARLWSFLRQFAIGRNRDALCLREELDAPAHVPSRIALVQLSQPLPMLDGCLRPCRSE
jgi:hypothetical protein